MADFRTGKVKYNINLEHLVYAGNKEVPPKQRGHGNRYKSQLKRALTGKLWSNLITKINNNNGL